MPSVKIPKKSTATDMTPFVDVAFLILSFFMLATKFKPPAAVEVKTPRSVSTQQLKEQDAVLVEFDSSGRVFFTMNTKKASDDDLKLKLIQSINTAKNLGLTNNEMENFRNFTTVGSPFSQLKSLLALPKDQRMKTKQAGIPTDSTNNELAVWITQAKTTFGADASRQVSYMIKGDNLAKYPSFNGVLDAMRKSDQFSYKLVTDPKAVPYGTALYKERNK